MFQNVSKTKKRKPRRYRSPADYPVGTVDGQPMNPDLKAAFQAEGLLPPDPGPTCNRVMVSLDNTVPGGFRLVPCP